MPRYVPGRQTALVEGDFVVFRIGARVNRPWRLIKGLRAIGGMQKMLRYLSQHPEKGMLAYDRAGLTFVQYWRSFDHLERFATDADDPHLEAWRKYQRLALRSGEAGVWHETFLVRAGEYEAVYANMPPIGLGKAGQLTSVKDASRARNRLTGRV